jgi:tRNA threonylcarbamoyladenosine biosynthesis protein TsaB
LRVLAIETSGASGSVAALADGRLLVELALERQQRGAQSLAPALAELLRLVSWKPREVELVGVSVGPGSFTSLRVGVTTAKTFAYAVSAQVLGIGTLEAIAVQAVELPSGGLIATAIDAQRGDVYAALFQCRGAFDLETIQSPAIHAADAWLAGLPNDVLVTGPALENLAVRLPPSVRPAPRDGWQPRASTVAQLAAAKFAAGERGDLWRLAPLYVRKSAAEERLVLPVSEKQGDSGDSPSLRVSDKETRRYGDTEQ